jgi:hypothetical protein
MKPNGNDLYVLPLLDALHIETAHCANSVDSPPPIIFFDIDKQLGPHTVDLFAFAFSTSSLERKLARPILLGGGRTAPLRRTLARREQPM